MFAVVYRWRIKPGQDQRFTEGWQRVTLAIQQRCGSYGSRLHVAEDGLRVAYARWPDDETRLRCEHGEVEGAEMMRHSIAESLPELRLVIDVDLLSEP